MAETDPPVRPRRLVVLGAGRGMGRWLTERFFSLVEWDRVVLADIDAALLDPAPRMTDGDHRPRVELAVVPHDLRGPAFGLRGEAVDLSGPDTVVCVCTPQAAVLETAAWIARWVEPGTQLFDTSSAKMAIQLSVSLACPQLRVFGAHPLFGPQIPSIDGQTIAVVPSRDEPTVHEWLVALIESVGGVALVESAAAHDRYMSYVQTLSHQTLLTFVDVLGASGEDLDALWDNRTPLFEALLGLAARTLTPGQERTVASIQHTTEGARVLEELHAALERMRSDIAEPTEALRHAVAERREPFSASLFQQVQLAASAMVAAAQSTRTEAAAHLRDGSLVGVGVGNESVHVGYVRHVDTNHIDIEDVLVGRPPRAALCADAFVDNAKRLGVSGRPRRIRVSVGRARFLSHDRLEQFLDVSLGRLNSDVRLLVPETVSGAAVCDALTGHPFVDAAELRAETIRLGQREVVARVAVRADRHVDAATLRDLVDDVYRPATGLVDPAVLLGGADSSDQVVVAHLGPDGTFSHLAALLVGGLAGTEVQCLGQVTVDEVLGAVVDHRADAAVLPVSNSSSGVVDVTLAACLATGPSADLRGCGVVDVGIRFAAYGKIERGVEVLSHPQALLQCAGFIRRHGLVPKEVSSTVVACDHVARAGRGVALARSGISDEVGLPIAADDVSDLGGAITRFVVVSRGDRPAHVPGPASRYVAVVPDATALDLSLTNAYVEVLSGGAGRALVVSSLPIAPSGSLDLGAMPWSPRTPMVAVGAPLSHQGDGDIAEPFPVAPA